LPEKPHVGITLKVSFREDPRGTGMFVVPLS